MADSRSLKTRVEALEGALLPAFARVAALEFWSRRLIMDRVDSAARHGNITRMAVLGGMRTREAVGAADAEFARLHPTFAPAEVRVALEAWLNLFDDCAILLGQSDSGGMPPSPEG